MKRPFHVFGIVVININIWRTMLLLIVNPQCPSSPAQQWENKQWRQPGSLFRPGSAAEDVGSEGLITERASLSHGLLARRCWLVGVPGSPRGEPGGGRVGRGVPSFHIWPLWPWRTGWRQRAWASYLPLSTAEFKGSFFLSKNTDIYILIH